MESDVASVEEIPNSENVEVVEEIAEDAMTTSSTSTSGIGQTNSDNESWTIIDDVEEEVSMDATKDQVKFVKSPVSTSEVEYPKTDTDNSDIETLDPCVHPDIGEETMDSLVSDGLPVTEDIGSESQGWIWEAEHPVEKDGQDSADRPEDLSSLVNELPVEFPSIQKGHTYSHVPNVKLNVLLTTALVLSAFMAIGLGIGHFKGWSEKLELQEQWSEEREEKLVELTDTLVTCITQDGHKTGLEDEVILQLNQENNDLKLALAKSQSCGSKVQVTDGNVLLRQRINELLIENADLEKEVVRLRYSHSAIADAESTKQDLINTKINLNNVVNENEQLKIEVGKARYSKASNTNSSLEEEEVIFDQDEDIDEAVVEGVVAQEQSTKDSCEPEKSKFHQAVDAVKNSYREIISSGSQPGSIGQKISKLSQKFNTEMDQILKVVPEKIGPTGKKIVRAAGKIAQKLQRSFDKGFKKATDFLSKSLGEDPAEWKAKQVAKLEESISVLFNDWTGNVEEVKEETTKEKTHGEERKTNMGERQTNVEERKTNVDERITKVEKRETNAKERNTKLEERKTNIEKRKTKQEERKTKGEDRKIKAEERKPKPYNFTSTGWMFTRAKERENQRREERRSSWLFDRARDREKFHKYTEKEGKKCTERDNNGNMICKYVKDRNPAGVNHGTSAHWRSKGDKEHWRHDKEDWMKRKHHDDDEDDDDDEEWEYKQRKDEGWKHKYRNKHYQQNNKRKFHHERSSKDHQTKYHKNYKHRKHQGNTIRR